MIKPKFKIGDRVTVYRSVHGHDLSKDRNYLQLGESDIIKSITIMEPVVYWFETKASGRYESELVLAEVYNSPLYIALKEDL